MDCLESKDGVDYTADSSWWLLFLRSVIQIAGAVGEDVSVGYAVKKALSCIH